MWCQRAVGAEARLVRLYVRAPASVHAPLASVPPHSLTTDEGSFEAIGDLSAAVLQHLGLIEDLR